MAYIRYTEIDDQNGRIKKLIFYGPFVDMEAARTALLNTNLAEWENEYGEDEFVRDTEEPLEFWKPVETIPTEGWKGR